MRTWGLWTSQTEWSTAMELPAEHGSGPRNCFFHLTDMTILNAFLIHKSCGGKMTHKNFRLILVRKLINHSQEENVTASGTSRGRPSRTAPQLSRPEVKHSQLGLPKEKNGGVACVHCRSKHRVRYISAGCVTFCA